MKGQYTNTVISIHEELKALRQELEAVKERLDTPSYEEAVALHRAQEAVRIINRKENR